MWIYMEECTGFHCLVESVELTSHSSHGAKPSHTVKTTDTLRLCCFHECMKDCLNAHRSGMTCEHLERRLLEACPLISSLAASRDHVKTLALQELEGAWRESEADYFSRSSESSKKSRQLSFSLKTFRGSEPEASLKSSKHLPLYAMTVDGELYPLPKLAHPISEKDGFFLPTPSASRYGSSNNGCPHDGRTEYKQKGKPSLWTMAAKNLWPTPTARDRKSGSKGKQENSRPLSEEVGGSLNPTWVEWLQGYPLEWTALRDWATVWFLHKLGKRSKD